MLAIHLTAHVSNTFCVKSFH